MIITPNTLGHRPPGYPVTHGSSGPYDSQSTLEEYSDKPDLELIKSELAEVQSDAAWYYNRCSNALNYWQSRWQGQSLDGRKWASPGITASDIHPWEGASDTRTRTVKMVINEHRTVGMYALMNMKLQAKSTRPGATIRESQQATTLLNWQLFSQLQAEWHRESKLNLAWRNGYGAAVVAVNWTQERRIDVIPINTMQFAQWIGMVTKQQFNILDVQDMLADSEQEKDLIIIIQAMSPIIDRNKARSILNDLRQLRTADVPIPYVFKSQPCITTLRPMVDVFFPVNTGDLQKARFVDQVEDITEPELYSRIDTDGYDPKFVDDACEFKGEPGEDPWIRRTDYERSSYGGAGWAPEQHDKTIRLHHFHYYSLDMGTPVLCKTVFHPSVESYATHGPLEYSHGEMPFHAMRFEIESRSILSSMGIAEIAYTWENELKTQFDARTDRALLALTPPLFADTSKILLLEKAWMPKAIIPSRRTDDPHFAPPPPYDPGSIQVSQDVMQRIDRYFWGDKEDPEMRKIKKQEFADDILTEWKPVFQQVFKLDQQLLPDSEVTAIVGQLHRPFQVSRHEIQAGHEISATVDYRELDNDFLKQKLGYLAQLKNMDTGGILDANDMVKHGAEAIDYTLADTAIQNVEQATNKEIVDEIGTVNRIIGSGMPEPLPQSGNLKLRLQTMQNHLQSADPKNPNQRLSDPSVQAVLQNRLEYFQRQLAQAEHAQIGRTQVPSPFAGGGDVAPQLTQGSGGGY